MKFELIVTIIALLSIVATVTIYDAVERQSILKLLDEFDGQVVFVEGKVYCNNGVGSPYSDGCYDFFSNEIKINTSLKNRGLRYIVNHELCHWRLQTYSEEEADECAYERM